MNIIPKIKNMTDEQLQKLLVEQQRKLASTRFRQFASDGKIRVINTVISMVSAEIQVRSRANTE